MAVSYRVRDPDHAVPSDTYKTQTAERADKAALKRLAKRMRVPESWLCLDGCGCWQIKGPTGHVYCWSDKRTWLGGYLVCVTCADAREWAIVRGKLGGKVRQNGEEDGVVLLMETEVNIPALRQAVGCTR
jgi:hypothetical protein